MAERGQALNHVAVVPKAQGKDGAQGRDRTTDTAIFSRMLYQLSYLGIDRRGSIVRTAT